MRARARSRRGGGPAALGAGLVLAAAAACVGEHGAPPHVARDVARASAPAASMGTASPSVDEVDDAAFEPTPRPAHVARGVGQFRIDRATAMRPDGTPASARIATTLARDLAAATGLSLVTESGRAEAPSIALRIDPNAASGAPEGYALRVTPDAIVLASATEAGLFYASRSLLQMVRRAGDGATVPSVTIEDAPRFPWRGVHLDVARHFFGRREVEALIDTAASYKLNVFHWHLTDDQGWRLPVAGRPLLTSVGARREEGGGTYEASYTRDEIEGIVRYAAERFVTVLPEVEMPGHARAAIAAYPGLSCRGAALPVPSTFGIFDDVLCVGNEDTYAFVEDVVADVARLFPGPYVHIGGDEVPTTRWHACPKCRALMRRERIDEAHLEAHFVARAAAIVATHGKRAAVWDEVVDAGLPADAIVLAWRGTSAGMAAARAGHDVVMMPSASCYLNAPQPGDALAATDEPLTWERVYAFEPAPDELEPAALRHVLGTEGALWTEAVVTDAQLEEAYFPRLVALAEVAWTPRERRDASAFARRFPPRRRELDARGVRSHVDPPVGLRAAAAFVGSTELRLAPPLLAPDARIEVAIEGAGQDAAPRTYRGAIPIATTVRVAARAVLPNGRASGLTRGLLRRDTLHPAAREDASALAPGLRYRYAEGVFRAVPALPPGDRAVRSGVVPVVQLPTPRAEDHFALELRGYVQVPAAGVFTFTLTSDDGSVLDVDGERVVDNDGLHAPRAREGDIALDAGLHAMTVRYFEGSRGEALSLGLIGPGVDEASVAPSRLFHE